MPRRFLFAALALLAVMAMSALHAAPTFADQRDFTLVNAGARTIYEVYVSSSDTTSWEEDVLGSDVLPAGSSVVIRFQRYEPGRCFYDVRVVADNGPEGVLYRINLCTTDTVTFS